MQLDAFHAHSVAQSKGSVNPYGNWKDLAWFKFRLPSTHLQTRIAQLLAVVREHAEAAEAVQAAAVAAGNAQFAEHAFVRSRDPVVLLSEVFSKSPESGCSAPERTDDSGHYVLGLQALTRHGYRPGQTKNVDPTDAMLRARLARGDLLISRSNTIDRVGFAAVFDEDREDISFPDTMMRLHVDTERALPEYIGRALMSPPGRQHIQRMAAGTSASMKKINRKGLGSFALPLPSLAYQQAAVDKARATTGLGENAAAARERATALQSALREDVLT